MTSEQQEFLRRLGEWDVASPWNAPPATEQDVAQVEVMLYLVDTLSLWNVVGGISEEKAGRLFELSQQAPPSLLPGAPALAGLAIMNAAKRGAGSLADGACQNALTLSSFYLTCTETYAQVRDKGSLRGHWIILHYHLEDGSRKVRPFYAPHPEKRKLTVEELMQLLVDVIARDLHSRASGLAQRIQEGGGLKLPAGLKSRVSPAGP